MTEKEENVKSCSSDVAEEGGSSTAQRTQASPTKDAGGECRKHEKPSRRLPGELPPKRAKVDPNLAKRSPVLTRSRSLGVLKEDKGKEKMKVVRKSIYKIKWVYHAGSMVPVVMQNENGPCPLIGIMNVLFLRGKLKLSEGTREVTEEELVDHVRQAVLTTMPKDCEEPNPNHLQNVQDAIALLPLLKTGLNVNVKFTGVKNFEYTPECIVFDLLDIHLYHGWLLDPQSPETMAAIGSISYNQLVEAIIDKKSSKDPAKVVEANIAELFLESTASQLTYHGLCELNAALPKGEMAVLFRNNHFGLLYKHEDMLCQLVTDQGFLEEKRVIWETLSTINGDETFLDGHFQCSVTKAPGDSFSSLHVIEEQQISQDFLVALSLQDEQNTQQDKEFGWDAYGNALGAIGMTSDEELARQLYVEEQRMALVSVSSSQMLSEEDKSETEEASQTPPAPEEPQDPPPKAKEWKCSIS